MSGKIDKLALYHMDASQVPESIRKLAEEKLPGAKLRRYETELYADKGRAYDVELTSADGRECEVAALAIGAVVAPPDAVAATGADGGFELIVIVPGWLQPARNARPSVAAPTTEMVR